MRKDLLNSLENAIKNWWISLLVGIIALVLGIWCIFTPVSTFLALTIVFVAAFFVGGILEICFAIANRNIIRNWGWTLAMGVIDLIFAIILLMNMEMAPAVFSFVIAFWILFQSISAFGMALDLQAYQGSGWGWILVMSILGLLFSTLLFFQPITAGLFAAYVFGFGFIFYGIARISIGLKLRSLHKFNNKD